jgi:hypothetical protein
MILKLSIVGLFIVLVVVLTVTYYTQLEGFIASKSAASVVATSGELLFTCAANTDIRGGNGNGTIYKASSNGRGGSVISKATETNATTIVSDCSCLKLGTNLAANVMMCTPGTDDAVTDTPAAAATRSAAAATRAAAVATRAADAAAGTPEETAAINAATTATSAATSATTAAAAATAAATRAASAAAALATAITTAAAATAGTPASVAAATAVETARSASTAAEATKVSTAAAATSAATTATEAAAAAAEAAAAATRVTAARTRASEAARKAASDTASTAANPQRNDVQPQVAISDTSYDAMGLKQKSDLLSNIQKMFRNELLANRSTDASVIDKTTSTSSTSSSTQQGNEFNKASQKCDGPSNDEDSYRCPKNPDGSCPPVPDMTQYIKKDAIPCWGCSVDY